MLTVIVSGMIAGDPYQGGAAWAVLQYVLGLGELGVDTYLVEPIQSKSLKPAGLPLKRSENAAYFQSVTEAFGLAGRSSLLLEGTQETIGLPHEELRRICRKASALINISGMLTAEELLDGVPQRIYLDLDPAFNQLWHTAEGIDMRFQAHNCFVTVGNAVGQPDCPVPTCGHEWITTLQPVVLRYWPPGNGIVYRALTTVGNWRGYGSIHHEGVHYGQKVHSLRQFLDLPARTSEDFLLALNIHGDETKDLQALSSNGWRLLDPLKVASTPAQYRNFIRSSKAEFGISKSGYVASRCGWFSDRSACYLASGRPVVAQDTGFSRSLPCGEGLLSFRDSSEAAGAIEEINRDYVRHSQAAREIAIEYFDSAKVLSRLLAAVGLDL